MKKLLFAAFAFVSLSAQAQEGGLNRRVEVTKAYSPEMGSAERLYARPRMEDTVALRPEISYSIRPVAWQTTFGVKPIAPAMVDARFDPVQPLGYLKAGFGFPQQSVADLYVHSKMDRGSLGVYLNHYGQYSDLENDLGVKVNATWSTNRAGVYGSLNAGSRMQLQGEVSYDWDYFKNYGLAVPAGDPTMDPGPVRVQGFSSPRGMLRFGHDFSDLSYFNFRLGASGCYFSDRYDNAQSDLSLSADLGRMFGAHRVTLGARFDGYYGSEGISDYKNTILNVIPMYALELERLKITMGFDFAVDRNDERTDLWFFPKMQLCWDVARGYFVPFVEADGNLRNNGYHALSRRNPHLMPGEPSNENTARYDLHGGISGSISSVFAYKIYAGGSVYRSRVSFVYAYYSGATGNFLLGAQDVTQLTLGGNLSGRIPGGFEALLALRMHAYPDNTDTQKTADLPNMEIDFTARYNHRNRLVLEAGVNVIGTRYFYGLPDPWADSPTIDAKVSPVADLHLSADYKFGDRWGVFLEGHNLLDTRLYPYNHYRGLGMNFLGGVKLTF